MGNGSTKSDNKIANPKLNATINPRLEEDTASLQDIIHGTAIGHHYKQLNNCKVDLSKELSHGSFGTVFKGYRSDKCMVAVKKICNYPQKLSIIHTEIEICYKLKDNKNIVQLYSHENDSDNYWLIFDYCDIGELSCYLQDNDLDLPTRVKIMVECTNAVAFMHSFRPPIVHCDIKPANILVKSYGKDQFIIKLADFGQGKLYECSHGHLTMHTLKGTPLFMAPEMLKIGMYLGNVSSERNKYYPSIDTFSLGLVLHIIVQDLCERSKVIPYTEQMFNTIKQPSIYGHELNEAHINKKILPVLHIPALTDPHRIALVTDVIALMTQFKDDDRMELLEAKEKLLKSYCYTVKEHVRDVCLKENLLAVKKFYSKQAELLQSTLQYEVQSTLWSDTLNYLKDINANRSSNTKSATKRRVPVSAKSSRHPTHATAACTLAIDIGNTYSCYAIRLGSKNTNCYSSIFPSSVLTECGVDGKFVAFGSEAEKLYNESICSGAKYELYQNWPLQLYPAKFNTFECVAVSQSGQTRPVADIYTMIFKAIWADAMSIPIKIIDHMIHWVLTIPSQWSDKAVNILTNAARNAGLNNIQTVVRSIAALYKCNQVTHVETWTDASNKLLFPLTQGSTVAIIDVGGSTVDTTWITYSKQTSDIIHTAVFETQHHQKTQQAFTQLLVDIYGDDIVNAYRNQHSTTWHRFLERWSIALHNPTSLNNVGIRINLPQDFEKTEINNYDQLQLLGLSFDKSNGILTIKQSCIDIYFKAIFDEILFVIKQELAIPKLSKLNNIPIVVTGGYSNSRYFQMIIQDEFKNTKHNILFHRDGQNMLIQGALIY